MDWSVGWIGLGAARAHRWFIGQALSVVIWATLDRIRGHRWERVGRPPRHHREARRTGGSGAARAVRDGLRVFRHARPYAAAVVATLSIAMGSTVAVFTVVHGVLLSGLPYPEADRLMRIDRLREDGTPGEWGVSWLDAQDWRDGVGTLEDLAVWHNTAETWVEDGLAELWSGSAMSANLFQVLGVQPLLGSAFDVDAGEGAPGDNSIYLAYGLWTRRFGRDPDVVGRRVELSGSTWTVRGVMPRGFAFPDAESDFWVPVRNSSLLTHRANGFLDVIARATPGASLGAVREEVGAAVSRIDAEFENRGHGVVVRSLADVIVAPVRRNLWLFLGAVGFFLLVAGSNVAGLGLTRVETRRRELAVRRSLGASGSSVFRALLAEALALALAGGLAGAGLAWVGVRALLALAPADLPRRAAIVLDAPVLGFAFLLALFCGLAFGIVPGLRGMRVDMDALRGRGGGKARGQRRLHRTIATVQVALAVLLLSGAGVLVRSFAELTHVETGYTDAAKVLTVELALARERWGGVDRALEFHRRLIEGLSAIPGAEVAAATSHLPFSGSSMRVAVVPADQVFQRDAASNIEVEIVDGAYFRTLGIALVRGRTFAGAAPASEGEVIINEAAARLLFPGGDALGRSFSFDVEEGERTSPDSRYTVIGIVSDVANHGLDQPPPARAYYGFSTFRRRWGFHSGRFFFLAVRARGDPMDLLGPVRRAVAGIDPTVPVQEPITLERRILNTAVTTRFRVAVLTFFAALAALLALVGMHGVVAYGVRQGMHEVGVRLALGESRTSVGRHVVREAAWMALGGGAAGLALAALLAPVLEGALFGVDARDPWTFGMVGVMVLGGAILAAWTPARRAARADPMSVLREE